jgi:hypothetical protein
VSVERARENRKRGKRKAAQCPHHHAVLRDGLLDGGERRNGGVADARDAGATMAAVERALGFRGVRRLRLEGKTPRVRAVLIGGPQGALVCGPKAESGEAARGEPDSGSSPGLVRGRMKDPTGGPRLSA